MNLNDIQKEEILKTFKKSFLDADRNEILLVEELFNKVVEKINKAIRERKFFCVYKLNKNESKKYKNIFTRYHQRKLFGWLEEYGIYIKLHSENLFETYCDPSDANKKFAEIRINHEILCKSFESEDEIDV